MLLRRYATNVIPWFAGMEMDLSASFAKDAFCLQVSFKNWKV